MSSASWTPATNAPAATWDENKALADLTRNAVIYDDPNTAYDDIAVYYDGYDPTGTTPGGDTPASWTPATNAATAGWAKVAE